MGEKRKVLIEMKYSPKLYASSMVLGSDEVPRLVAAALPPLPGADVDMSFGAVELPSQSKVEKARRFNPYDLSDGMTVNEDPEAASYLVRGTVDEAAVDALRAAPGVTGVYADCRIQVCHEEAALDQAEATTPPPPQICPGSPPLGTERHVALQLGVPALWRKRMNGLGVLVAVVDTGINIAYLRGRGKRALFDAGRSWLPGPGVAGSLPVGHGTMCAYDALIAAPNATLLDIAVLRSTSSGGSAMEGLLSDAVKAYVHLLRVMLAPRRPGECRSLVVTNSWGMFHPSWDFPIDHPGNYSDNALHPFNRAVSALDRTGADILFAAGNCGRECPDGRCRGETARGIYGANSHSQVLSVAGVDVLRRRVGYSTSGPGRVASQKPDLCGYTHFQGSGVYPADGGTSAATPVVAGLVAALRSRFPYDPGDFRSTPAAIRNMLTHTALDRGAIGFDYDYGWGIANGQRVADLTSLSLTAAAAEPEVYAEQALAAIERRIAPELVEIYDRTVIPTETENVEMVAAAPPQLIEVDKVVTPGAPPSPQDGHPRA